MAKIKRVSAYIGKPYDAEIEYLESTGTQYIDTGVYGNNLTTADLRGYSTAAKGVQSPVFGSRISWANRSFGLYNGYDGNTVYTFFFGSTSNASAAISNVSATTNIVHDFHIANVCSVDGVGNPPWYNNDVPEFTTPKTMLLFAIHWSTTNIGCGLWRVYKCQIYQNNILVRDFIPVRFTNEQGQTEGAMYDKVSGQLFRNQGTGSFVLGPDKRKHTRIYLPSSSTLSDPSKKIVPSVMNLVSGGVLSKGLCAGWTNCHVGRN